MPKGNGSMLTRPMDGKRYVLASGSPRRRELLGMLDVEFRVDTSRPVDEVVPPTLPAAEVPAYLSRLKAQPYMAGLEPDEILITADTVVILDDRVIGKPKDADDARRILRSLAGRTHRVVTGVSIGRPDGSLETFSDTTEVDFDELTDADIDYYVENYRPLDKAGAYGIQGLASQFIEGIDGDYFNVMGLPLCRLGLILKALGVKLL